MIYLLVLLLGVTAGLRAATPLAAVSIAAYLGWIDLSSTWAGFVGSIITVIVLCALALFEFVGDQLPQTPSRKSPLQFGGRVVTGALAGAVFGLASGSWIIGVVLGAIGAVIGTLGGYGARRAMAKAFGRDRPAAIIEDVLAVVVALGVLYLA